MTNSWSDSLIYKTRDVLDLGCVPIDDFIHMKNINGEFGQISLNHWMSGQLIIQDKRSDVIYRYSTVDELIAAGWAVD